MTARVMSAEWVADLRNFFVDDVADRDVAVLCDSHEALRAALEESRRERDAARADSAVQGGYYEVAQRELARVTAERDALRAELEDLTSKTSRAMLDAATVRQAALQEGRVERDALLAVLEAARATCDRTLSEILEYAPGVRLCDAIAAYDARSRQP